MLEATRNGGYAIPTAPRQLIGDGEVVTEASKSYAATRGAPGALLRRSRGTNREVVFRGRGASDAVEEPKGDGAVSWTVAERRLVPHGLLALGAIQFW